MATHRARSGLKITNGGFFERGITGITNYELRRHLLKSLIIRLVRHARSRLGATLARAGARPVGAARRSRKAGAASGRPIVPAARSAAIAPGDGSTASQSAKRPAQRASSAAVCYV
jgi:hypothetical protein